MAVVSRAQLLKELLPGLNALFGLEYDGYENEHADIYETENSDRSFEEEVKLSGFGAVCVLVSVGVWSQIDGAAANPPRGRGGAFIGVDARAQPVSGGMA